MNFPIQQITPQLAREDAFPWRRYWLLIRNNSLLVFSIFVLVTSAGVAYALLAAPVYQSNILIQVADPGGVSAGILGESGASAEARKPEASAEIGVLKSRRIIAAAVDRTHAYIESRPSYFPLIGAGIARSNPELSEPGLFGFGGFAWGRERAEVSRFDVPRSLENTEFSLTAEGNGHYLLSHDGESFRGEVGELEQWRQGSRTIVLQVDKLEARAGVKFSIRRSSRLDAIEDLQAALKIAETGKQSGIISVGLESTNPSQAARLLREIGAEYLRQNEERKAQDAERALASLNRQLPHLKQELAKAESEYNAVRHSLGTIDLQEEAKSILQRSVSAQIRMSELRQRKEDLLVRFQEDAPAVVAVTQQMQVVSRDLAGVEASIKRLPAVEQDVLRLSRDVKVNTEVYSAVLTTAQQLQLIMASKGGFARLLDAPELPERPVKPRRMMIIAAAAAAGLLLGCLGAWFRKVYYRRVDEPAEIVEELGLPVRAAIPYSAALAAAGTKMEASRKLGAGFGARTEASASNMQGNVHANDATVECLRRFRTTLQFDLQDARNNIVAITGATPGVGKSFVSANLAAVMAACGKKVLLIDADLRTGYLHRRFGLQRRVGLSEAVLEQLPAQQAIHREVMKNLDFLSTGSSLSSPAEVLADERLALTLQQLATRYDLIVIDTAPVLMAADALTVALHAGSTFTVVRAGISTIDEIEEAVGQLNAAGATISGVVFNGHHPHTGSYGGAYGIYGRHAYAMENARGTRVRGELIAEGG
ncbi:polysaccharide biosynthesis tyrosine autokinase [Noviherbaspirillum sp. CPCC 100848]|uniref:Polysaccharide biosynthesis tyrosine autokinase n=1 Tax=Noviherbaspirillum album TaxID=3080276 RepID=A0ABU6J736_9BURK|nr:polysaccharide biosynthesis tyrosine autokinase [Noviherbaspirillum sp. CPCC 100848]MEC4719426.1 polysaccharide biosynthesis tyrosine autokinase [Noviherbaspirillum sp. CPCC 100848]